jgi:type III pantothenate kinase
MNLCIDWGNTRVKFAIFDGENLVKGFNCTAEEALVGIMDVVKTYSPERAIFSSVAQHPPELPVLLAEHTNLITLSSSTALPIINAYHSSETLGADRIALAVAAHHLYANASTLVISMGTAITYNFTQRTGTFRGGNITPGVHMRLQALHDYTQKLPSVSFDGDTLL